MRLTGFGWDNQPDDLPYGFDPGCDYYDDEFCYRIEQFPLPRWTGYRSWFDWRHREAFLWALEPASLIANAIAHMRERQDTGRLQRLGDWVYAHESDPELYRQRLAELCERITSFDLHAKAQSRLVFSPLDSGSGMTLPTTQVTSTSLSDLDKPLTATRPVNASAKDDAIASLIARAKGFSPEKPPVKGNFEDTRYRVASVAGRVADRLKDVAISAGASQIDSGIVDGTGYAIPQDDYLPSSRDRHRAKDDEYYYPDKQAILHDRIERATKERDLAIKEGKPQSTIANFNRRNF